MTINELKVLEIICDWGGEASIDTIAREFRMSLNYAKVLCQSLAKGDYLDFPYPKICKIKGKGKAELIRRKFKSPSRIAVNTNLAIFSRNKKGRLILDY